MRSTYIVLGLLALLGFSTLGCGGPTRSPQRIEVKGDDPMAEPESILRNYVGGQPVGSEADGFDQMVAKVREKDAGKADILAEAFAAIKKSPASCKSIASKALDKLNQPVR